MMSWISKLGGNKLQSIDRHGPTSQSSESARVNNELAAFFRKEELPLPYIGDKFKNKIFKISDSIYGSRKCEDATLEEWIFFFGEILDGKEIDDYILMGFDGRGTNSWAMHYYYVTQDIAVFIQVPWRGAYVDNERMKKIMKNYFSATEKLIKQVEDMKKNNKDLHKNERFVICALAESIVPKWTWVPLGGIDHKNDVNWEFSCTQAIDPDLKLDA